VEENDMNDLDLQNDYVSKLYELFVDEFSLTEEIATLEEFSAAFDISIYKTMYAYGDATWIPLRLDNYETFLATILWDNMLLPYVQTTTKIFDILYPSKQPQ
jgi:hypothetical protein